MAQRELLEEAGLEAADWTHLTTTYSSPGHLHRDRSTTSSPAACAHVDRGDFEPEHEEAEMEALWVPFADLLEAVEAGRVADGPLVIAVLMAHARGKATPRRPER